MPKSKDSILIDRMHEEHEKEGVRKYGKRRWSSANYGWGQDDFSICTKVYGMKKGVRTMCLTTTVFEDGSVEHEHVPYGLI